MDKHLNNRSIDLVADCDGLRLDIFIAKHTEFSRSFIQNAIKKDNALVNQKIKKANYILRSGDKITLNIEEPKEIELIGQNIPIDIIYQDADIAIINKQQGMVVHPAPGNYDGTLVNALMYHIKDLSGISGEIRPGIVHRLDKDTTGLIMIAKNDKAHNALSEQIKNKSAKRIYLAIIEGYLKETKGVIDQPIGRHKTDRKKMAVVKDGRQAITHYDVLEVYKGLSLVKCSLETGRTHQIRVHMSYLNRPILGDAVYGREKNRFGLKVQALHASKLTLCHPTSGERMDFFAPTPRYFVNICNILRNENKDVDYQLDLNKPF